MAGVIGTGVQQPTAQMINTLDAISQKYIHGEIGDIVFKPSPVFWALMRNGKDIRYGAELVYPLVTSEELTGGAYYGDQLLNTTVIDSIVPANQVWRPYYQNVSIPVTDIILGRGGSAGLDLVEVKLEIGGASFLQKLARAVWGTSPQNTTIDVDNIPNWVFSTSNTIAGINRSSVTAWQPSANFPAGGALTAANAELAYQQIVLGYDEPDILILTNKDFANFKNQFTSLIRFINLEQDSEALQAGFRYHFVYNNAVVIADPFCPATQGYLLNSKYIFPVFNGNDYFTLDPWMQPSNQRVVVTKIYLQWQISCTSPRMQVCITGMP
jgi:hypothetical protein